MRKYILLVISTLISIHASAQRANNETPNDSLIHVYGKVMKYDSNEPIGATIIFEKMPYSGDIRITKSSPKTGEFELAILFDESYTIDIKADGYLDIYDVLNKKDINKDGNIYKEYYMSLFRIGQTLRLNNINFDLGEAVILDSSEDELNGLVKIMKRNENMKIQLEGHTDLRGSNTQNLELSKKRVQAVREYLISKGVTKNRIKIKAFGGTKPISKANTEEGRNMNRRVEVRILSI